jgi:hypothetical protein
MTAQLLQFEGPDADRFLQAQLATDLAGILVGQWRWAALLSLKGRVLAHAPLARVVDQRWLWLLPADLCASMSAHLSRYVLRSKVRIEQIPARCAAIPGATAATPGRGPIEAAGAAESRLAGVAPQWDLIVSTDANALAGHCDPTSAESTEQAFHRARLHALLPLITALSSDRHLPQPLGLLDLGSVSVKKGCYPGQEIVARTHYLGRSKRVACLLKGTLPMPVATASVLQSDRNAGEVVEAQEDGADYLALAVVEEAVLGGELVIEGRNAVLVASSRSL